MTRTALFALVLGLFGCDASETFNCLEDAQCGEGGVCEANSTCSFEDEACASGRRYGEFAPMGIAGACVRDDEPSVEPSVEPEPLQEETEFESVCGREATCEACVACTLYDGPCAAPTWSCSASEACFGGLLCGQNCLLTGVCDDCCAGPAAAHADTIGAANACAVLECAALCGSEREPACEG